MLAGENLPVEIELKDKICCGFLQTFPLRFNLKYNTINVFKKNDYEKAVDFSLSFRESAQNKWQS